MKRLLALALAAVAVAPGVAGAAPCQEDQPCWSWPTMGNLDRGVYVKGSDRIRVVDASEYCRLARARKLDTRRTASLKGDHLARTRGCNVRYFAQPA